MRKAWLLICIFLCVSAPAFAREGVLVIAGGAVQTNNAAIYGAFVEAARQSGRDEILIIPAASGEPALSAASARAALTAHGAAREHINVLEIASVDDASTTDTNEALWSRNSWRPDFAARVRRAGGVWFTGGDQLRAMRTLTDGASVSPVLHALRQRLRAGLVIGGTSAGAALMSDPMIARGDGLASMLLPMLGPDADDAALESGALALRPGAGLFAFGLVDQHFNAQDRLGRLVRALGTGEASSRVGFGIDENTALIVDLNTRRGRVVGAGAVTMVDARAARYGQDLNAAGVRLGVLQAGDLYDFARHEPVFAARSVAAPARTSTLNAPRFIGAAPHGLVSSALSRALFASDEVTVIAHDETGSGMRHHFTRGADARFFGGGDRLSAAGLEVAMAPGRLVFMPEERTTDAR